MTQADNSNRYNKLNTTTLCIRLNRKTDTDIIERLKAVQSKQGYVKRLIRQDIEQDDFTDTEGNVWTRQTGWKIKGAVTRSENI